MRFYTRWVSGFSVRLAVIVIAFMCAQSSAVAQNEIQKFIENSLLKHTGTTQVYAQPYLTNGSLAGCHLIFSAIMRDRTYRQGGFLKVDGSFGLMGEQLKFGVVLKVVVHEINLKDLSFTPSAPSRAYIIGRDFQTNLQSLVNSDTSDTPGALFSIFQMEPSIQLLFEALQQEEITIAFNSLGGSSDIQLPIELDVVNTDDNGVRTRSKEAVNRFSECMMQLIK